MNEIELRPSMKAIAIRGGIGYKVFTLECWVQFHPGLKPNQRIKLEHKK